VGGSCAEGEAPPDAWRFEIVDAAGRPTPARVSLRDPAGAGVFPAGVRPHQDPSGEPYFYSDRRFALEIEAERLHVVVSKGFEHEIIERTVTRSPQPIRLQLRRVLAMEERGWYSGDGHVHPYHALMEQELSNAELLRQLKAEDLNVVSLLAANGSRDRVWGGDRITGRIEPDSEPSYLLQFSEEYRSFNFGHMSVYGVKALSDPAYTGFAGTRHPFDHPTNHDANLAYRAQGAFPSFAHLQPKGHGLRTPECPVDVALGSLNVTAGTDAFIARRQHPRIGGARAYVQMDGRPFGYESWVDQLARGRAFVTNGAMLFLRVDGSVPGQSLELPPGGTRTVHVEVSVESVLPWSRVEVRRPGAPPLVFRADPEAQRVQHFHGQLSLDGPGWIYAKLTGPPSRHLARGGWVPKQVVAVTNAIWVRRGDEARRDAESLRYFVEWVEDDLDRLERRNNYGSAGNREHVRGVFEAALEVFRERLAEAESGRPPPLRPQDVEPR
jgi:hypothetical protein